MCVGARALRARSAALSKVIVRTEQNNFAGGGAVAGLVLRAPVEQMRTPGLPADYRAVHSSLLLSRLNDERWQNDHPPRLAFPIYEASSLLQKD